MALGNGTDPTVIWRNDAGTLTGTSWAADDSLYFSTQDMAWGDVDGDGDEDLATIEFGNGHVRVYLNEGGTLETIPSWFYDLSESGQAIAWGDVNGDGFLDLAVGTARGPVYLFLNTTVATGATEVRSDPGWTENLTAAPNPFREATTIVLAGARPGGSATCTSCVRRRRRACGRDA
jgi:FG-GAP-like repeat